MATFGGTDESSEAGERALAAVAALADSAAAVDVSACAAWPARVRQALLAALDRLEVAQGLLRAPVLLAEQRAGTSERPGDVSFESAHGRRSGKGVGAVRRELRQAETLTSMPGVAGAVREGEMTTAHVDAIARVAASGDGAGSRLLGTPEGQAAAVELAQGRDATAYAKRLAQYVADNDPTAHERDHAAQHAARYLVLSDQSDATLIKGRLDRVAGERLRLALEAVGNAPDEHRSREQADADALVTLADAALDGTSLPGDAGARRPHVSILLRDETLAAILAERATREPARGAGLRVPAPAALSESGLPLPRTEVARILCDAEVARVVVDARDVPLSLGRSQRLYTGAQRRAVIARDKACGWPGCGRLPRWCQVHHIRWWERDRGPTSVENGVLLCSYHHHLVHQLDLTITRHVPSFGDDGVTYSFRTSTGALVAPRADRREQRPLAAPPRSSQVDRPPGTPEGPGTARDAASAASTRPMPGGPTTRTGAERRPPERTFPTRGRPPEPAPGCEVIPASHASAAAPGASGVTGAARAGSSGPPGATRPTPTGPVAPTPSERPEATRGRPRTGPGSGREPTATLWDDRIAAQAPDPPF